MTAAAASEAADSSQGSGLKVKKGLNEVPASDAPSLVRGDEDPEANQATERDEEEDDQDYGDEAAKNEQQEEEDEEAGEVQLDDAAFEEVKL